MKTKTSTMKTKARITFFGLVMLIAFCYVNFARADSNFATGAAAQSSGAGAPVNLDFQIIIPQFIFFQVGTAGSVDTINFSPTATDVATPGATTSGTGGDLGSGTVTVSLVSNAGGVDITEMNNSIGLGLGNGSGQYISYGQINTATNNGNLPAPVLSNAALNSVSITPTAGNITVRNAQWTYTYDNPATPPAVGTYGAGGGTGGSVTYTAAIP